VGRSRSPGCGTCLIAAPGRPASPTFTPTCLPHLRARVAQRRRDRG
jgi:hypothetical protein